MVNIEDLPDYDWQLAILREGGRLLEQEDMGEGARYEAARRVMEAYTFLTQRDSPCVEDLTESDLCIVAVARLVSEPLDQVPS